MDSEQYSPKTERPEVVPGGLHSRFVRCGKPACRCACGVLHGPYLRRFWREDRRIRSRYVPLASVRAAWHLRVKAALIQARPRLASAP